MKRVIKKFFPTAAFFVCICIKITKKFIGEIILIVGTSLFTYNIFNFSYRGGTGGEWMGRGRLSPRINKYEFEYVAYYYDIDTLLMISIAAALIVIGILVVRSRQK